MSKLKFTAEKKIEIIEAFLSGTVTHSQLRAVYRIEYAGWDGAAYAPDILLSPCRPPSFVYYGLTIVRSFPSFPPGTMTSADSLQFVVTTRFFPRCACKASPGTHTFFPSSPAIFTTDDSMQLLDFDLLRSLVLVWGLIYGFCSSGQSFAAIFLQIPPRDGHP